MMSALTMTERLVAEIERARDQERDALSPMDEAAFRAFYDRTARPLRVYLARITGDTQIADDLLQESYYRFFRAGGSHESESHRRNSLFQIATNLARDVKRRSGGRQFVPLDDDAERGLPVDRAAAERSENRTDLHRALERLKPSQRQMLWLAYALGCTHDEIAEVVGVSPVSVRPLLFRARQKVAQLLRGGEEKRS